MVKVKPSAVLAPAVNWKPNCVLKAVTSTLLVEKALLASLVPPSVSCRAVPLILAEPLRVRIPLALAKPLEKSRIGAWLEVVALAVLE